MVKRGEGIFSIFRGELAKRGELKNSGGGGGTNGEKWGISQSVFPIPHKINSPFFPIFPHFPPIFYGIFVKNLPLRSS